MPDDSDHPTASVRFTRIEIEAVSHQDYRVATDTAIAVAHDQHPDITWFRVKRLGGTVEAGRRTDTRIRVEVGP